jgi:nicotinamidase/pyrazinamidase
MRSELLIVVDMLNDFIRPEGALYCGVGARAIVPFIRERIDAFRAAGNTIIYLQDAHASDDKEFERFAPHCVSGTRGSQIIEELAPRAGEPVLSKTRYSGFYGTPLEKILAELQPAVVEVVGVCTSICVMDTVGGLANRDYMVRVPSKGVADFDEAFHRFALERMQRLYGAKVA